MKRLLIFLLFSAGAVTAGYGQSRGYVDDLYRGSTRQSRADEAEARKSAQRASRQQVPVNWTPAQETRPAAVATPERGELVTHFDDALARRLEAYRNYREMDDSYWQLMENYHAMLSRKYDPDLYNIITFGNEMWVEPVYISALFDGSDPAARVYGKQLVLPAPPQTDVRIRLNFGFGRPWVDPWGYGWYGSWWSPAWRWSPYWDFGYWRPAWGWNWGLSWSWGWGPSWYPGWGPGWWGPGYYPSHWGGGGFRPHTPARPVIWGSGPRPAYRPGPEARPGAGSAAGRPTYPGGFRRNENGTGVTVNNGSGAANPRPGSTIRPGSIGNRYNPSTRPSVDAGGQGSAPAASQSPDRSYRREATPAPAPTQRRETTTRTETPRRSEPSYSAPSRSSTGGGSSQSSGGFSGGGGRRR